MKRFKKLDRNARQYKVETLAGYLEGRCCILAVAFHREFGEQIVFLMNSRGFVHACTRTAEGKFRDARGIVPPELIAGNIFDLPESYEVKEVSEAEVFTFTDNVSSRFTDAHVEVAICRAQTVWPHWPWRNSFLTRSLAFLADLERISKLHGVYIHAKVPASPPVLTSLDSDHELKYSIQEGEIGLHFFLETT